MLSCWPRSLSLRLELTLPGLTCGCPEAHRDYSESPAEAQRSSLESGSVSPASHHPPHLPPASAVSLSPNHTLRPSLRSLYLLPLFQPSCSSPFCCYRPVRSAGSSLPGVVCLSLTSSRSFAHIRFYLHSTVLTTITPFPELDPPSWQFHALTRHVKPSEPSELLDPEYPATGFTKSWSCLPARSIADKIQGLGGG